MIDLETMAMAFVGMGDEEFHKVKKWDGMFPIDHDKGLVKCPMCNRWFGDLHTSWLKCNEPDILVPALQYCRQHLMDCRGPYSDLKIGTVP